ncbi:MAG: hypothetical protein JST92_27005, partial [Deltaproteobacteria bacterium]|nr:hypothetical protein [Deltaproteobacteria bacterium]
GSIETFYLGDNARAAQAMREASRLPGAPAYVPFLATRLQANAGDLDSAESMAREMAEQSTEEGTRREWEARLVDLAAERIALQIDAASARYKARTGQNPLNVLALVTSRDLTELPIDPRGGTFSIDADGMAQSTAGRRLKYRGKGNSFGLEVK